MKNIHIICEGYEDFKYLARLKELKVFSNIYNISLDNVKGSESFFYKYQNDNFFISMYYANNFITFRICKARITI